MTRRAILTLALSVTLIAALPAAAGAHHHPPVAANPGVITTWNAIAVNTIAGPAPNGAGMVGAPTFLYFGFVQAAVYNAVNGITREYELYKWHARAPKGASPEAAAAAAAYRVLLTYFGDTPTNGPTITANLNAAFAASLAQIPDGRSKDQGIRFGARAADHIIRLRADDGRNDPSIVFNVPLAPGVWRPAPPANAPFLAPWLSHVDPLVLDSPSQFRPGPPPRSTRRSTSMSSTRYATTA